MKLSASPKPMGDQVTAHSSAPASPLRSARPAKTGVTVSSSPTRSARASARPPGKCRVASAGVASVIRSGAQVHLISTPRNR
ncbi:hypothetical protein D3C86_1184730 [compost metagenome]